MKKIDGATERKRREEKVAKEKAAAAVPVAASLKLKAEKQSAHSSWVISVAFSHDGKSIVSGSRDKTIKVWDAGDPAHPVPYLTQT